MLLWLLFRFIALFTWVASKLNTPNDAMGVLSNILVVKTRNSQYHFYEYQRRNKNMKLWIQMTKWFDHLKAFLFNLDNIPISFVFQKTHRSSRKTNPSCFQIGARSWWSIELRTHLDSRQLLCNHRISSIVQADTTLSQGKKASNTDLALQHISAIYRLNVILILKFFKNGFWLSYLYLDS